MQKCLFQFLFLLKRCCQFEGIYGAIRERAHGDADSKEREGLNWYSSVLIKIIFKAGSGSMCLQFYICEPEADISVSWRPV